MIDITNDQSKYTRAEVENLENSIIFGVILVVLVLMFFLGFRNALFVGVAIPLSMFISFLILNSLGISLNFMVLFSLILALGDRKSTRLNSSHVRISYAVFCLKKKNSHD